MSFCSLADVRRTLPQTPSARGWLRQTDWQGRNNWWIYCDRACFRYHRNKTEPSCLKQQTSFVHGFEGGGDSANRMPRWLGSRIATFYVFSRCFEATRRNIFSARKRIVAKYLN
eukprot:5990146-Prymnesium_polylepis.1